MNENIMLKTNEVTALINIIEMLYLMCDGDGEEVECMYDDMQALRRLRDKLEMFCDEEGS